MKNKKKLKDICDFQLLPRLKLMGCLLLILGISLFSYGYFSKEIASDYDLEETPLALFSAAGFEEGSDENPPFELNRKEKIQSYIISLIFVGIGSLCLFLVRFKKKQFLS